MLCVNGQNFNAAVQVGSRIGPIMDYASASVGGRTCIVFTGTTEGACYLGWNYPEKVANTISLSSDSSLRPCILDAALCFPTLDATTDWFSNVGFFFISDLGNSGGIYLYLQAIMASGVCTLRLRYSRAGTDYDLALGPVAQGTVFHRLLLHLYRDKAKIWWEGLAKSDLVFTNTSFDSLFPHTVALLWPVPSKCKTAWDYIRFGEEDQSYTATLGQSETNGHPDNGTIYLVPKTVLQGLIAAGTAKALGVADGMFSVGAADDGDYLLSKVLADNDGGTALKLNKSGPNWTVANW